MPCDDFRSGRNLGRERNMEQIVRILAFSALYLAAFFGIAQLTSITMPLQATALGIAGVWLSVTELDRFEIPDTSALLIGAVGIWRICEHPNDALPYFGTAIVVLVLSWCLSTLTYVLRDGQEGLGLGDVKLMAAVAICLGPHIFPIALFFAATTGASLILFQSGFSKLANLTRSHQKELPFGPFLAYANFMFFQMSF